MFYIDAYNNTTTTDFHTWSDLGDDAQVGQKCPDGLGLGTPLTTTDIEGNPVDGEVQGLAYIDGHWRVRAEQ